MFYQVSEKESQLVQQRGELEGEIRNLQENLKCSEEESKNQAVKQQQLQAMVKNLEQANHLLKEENDNATNFIEQLQNEVGF